MSWCFNLHLPCLGMSKWLCNKYVHVRGCVYFQSFFRRATSFRTYPCHNPPIYCWSAFRRAFANGTLGRCHGLQGSNEPTTTFSSYLTCPRRLPQISKKCYYRNIVLGGARRQNGEGGWTYDRLTPVGSYWRISSSQPSASSNSMPFVFYRRNDRSVDNL